MKKLYSIVGMWIVSAFCLLSAQSRVYSSVENVHSHNDYLQNVPFYTAYSTRCASIEADVFLVDGELYVAHKENEINKARKLRNLYLNPIREQFEMNGGSGYPNGKSFQLLIDLKTDYKETMKVLEQQLLEYRDCFDVKKNPLAVGWLSVAFSLHRKNFPITQILFSSTEDPDSSIRRNRACVYP